MIEKTHEIHNENQNNSGEEEPKIESVSLGEIKSAKDDELVDRIMQKILKIK